MRDLILKMSLSIDGFVADADGGIAWAFGNDRDAKAWSVETLWNAGLHIMGSRTFQAMSAHWPTATDMFAPPMNQIPKTVFSRKGPALLTDLSTTTRRPAEPQPGSGSWAEACVASADLATDIARLKAEPGKPIIAHGGARFARSLIAQDLIDQFTLLMCPVVLGGGLPLFSGLVAPKPLTLISAKAFPGGAVALVYRAG